MTADRHAWTLIVGLVTASSVGRADPSVGYVTAGTETALGPFAPGNASVTVDGGYRIAGSRWFAHAMTAYGTAGDFDMQHGSSYQLEGGVEHRDCIREAVCFSSGLDLGFVTSRMVSPIEHHAGPVVRGRAAIDVGGARLRARFGIDLELADDAASGTYDMGRRLVPFGKSLGAQLAVMYLF
jgi:hypothetical protein